MRRLVDALLEVLRARLSRMVAIDRIAVVSARLPEAVLAVEAYGARVVVRARASLALRSPELRLHVERVEMGALPADCRVTGELCVGARRMTGDLRVATPKSRIDVALDLDARGRLHGTRARGTVAVADALALGVFRGTHVPHRRGMVEIDLAVDGALHAPVVSGTATAARLEIVDAARPFVPGLVVKDATLRARASRDLVTITSLAAEIEGGAFSASGRVVDGVPDLRVRGAFGAKLAESLLRDAPLPFAVKVPRDLHAEAALHVKGDGATGEITLATRASRVEVALACTREMRLDGTRAKGKVAFAELPPIRDAGFRPVHASPVTFDAEISGAAASPRIDGTFACKNARIAQPESPELPRFDVEEVEGSFRAERERMAWRGVSMRAYGGIVRGEGVARAGALGPLRARVAWEGVRVELLPTRPTGERELASVLAGASSGEMLVARDAAGGPLVGKGHGRVDDPDYRVIHHVARDLEAAGLPVPATRGLGPAEARIVLDARALRLRDARARMRGIDVAGELAVDIHDGSLKGRLAAHLLDEYLRTSAMLAVPAAFAGRIKVRVDLGGTLRAPRFEVDAMQALGAMLRDNRIGDAVKAVVGEMLGAFAGKRRTR